MVKSLPNIHFSKGICQGCVLGKHPQEKFEKGKARRSYSPLELIHSDLMGPFPHPSISKARYVLTFIDDFSQYTWKYFLRQKSEVFEHLKDFKAHAKTQSRRKIKILCTDNGGGICEPRCPTSMFRGRYTAATHSTLHSAAERCSREEERIPQGDGHFHVACKISTTQALG
jgi:hypothetical protein